MKNTILFIALFFCSLNLQSQDKEYTLREVEIAPKMLKYKNVDLLDSKQNFKRSLNRFIVMNIDFSKYHGKKTKVFVEFVVKSNGEFEILRVKGKSDQAKTIVIKAFEKVKKMNPASIKNKNVTMKFIIPITINEVMIIDTTKKSRW